MAASVDLHELLIRSVVDYAIYMLNADGYVISWKSGRPAHQGLRPRRGDRACTCRSSTQRKIKTPGVPKTGR